jgi:hypothetical protein
MAQVPDEVADQLYATAPEGFVAARQRAAKAAGDPAQAAAIAKLRKPTVAAWVINLMAIKQPEQVAGLVELAAQLRTAQRELKGAQLRELARQRRTVVTSLVDSAVELAAREQPKLKPPLAEIEATLNAALADEEVARQVRTGRLLKTTSYAGFGELPSAEVSDTATARNDLREARKAEEAAVAEVEEAAQAESDAATEVEEIDEQLTQLRQRRQAAAEKLSELKASHVASQRTLAAARRRVSEAEAAADS